SATALRPPAIGPIQAPGRAVLVRGSEASLVWSAFWRGRLFRLLAARSFEPGFGTVPAGSGPVVPPALAPGSGAVSTLFRFSRWPLLHLRAMHAGTGLHQ